MTTMKKIIMPVVAVMLCMTGCKKEQEGFLRLEVEHFNSDAKMHIDVEGNAAYSVWDDGDLVMVNGEVCTVSVNSNSAVIGNLLASEGVAYSAVYPASIVTSMSDNGATVQLPAVQQYRENGAGQQVVEVPMTAYCGSEDNTLSFHNLGSLLAVKVENTTGGAMKVWRIRVEATQPLSGTYTIADLNTPTLSNATDAGNKVYLDFDKGVSIAAGGSKVFYLALPPVTDAKFTIEVYSSNTMYQRTQNTATATFERNTAHEVPFIAGPDTYSANIMLYEGCEALNIQRFGEYADVYSDVFDSDNKMGYFTFDDHIGVIPQETFRGCTSLTSVVIPENVVSIGAWAFENCSSLASIVIPEWVSMIDDGAFKGCSSLTSINIPEGVTMIKNNAFSGCTSLTSINIPEGVTMIKNNAFSGCTSLTSINIPEGVTEIKNYAFSGCTSLTSINIPEGVTEIASGVFYGCESLTSIDIPVNVASIGGAAFEECINLSRINCWPQTPPELDGNAFRDISRDVRIHVLQDEYFDVCHCYIEQWWYVFSGNQFVPDLCL